jgi:chromosome segregation ATPase
MTQKRLEDEGSATRSAEEQADKADKFYQEMHGNLKTTEKQMKTVKDELFRHAQELYKLRQEEATTLGEISGAQSAIKNLQHQIQRLDVERQRQQELLYAVDFQSQSMQRKVARVSGERTLEEKDELMKRIAANEKEYEEKLALWTILSQQHKKQDSELRHAQRTIVKMDDESHKVKEEMDELQLQNDILQRMMGQTTKEKEEVLVHHDVMKLEVNRLRNKLQAKTEQVFALENRKHQLALSMQEREKEVEVHLDVLRAQYRVAEEERHARAIESAERKQKIYTLKMKYEATVAKTKKADDADHSQAYYVLQAAQVKEELQRKGDELDAKIRKAEREIRALENTLAHLLARNQKYKENFKSADKQQEMQLEEKQLLDSQYRAANEVLFKKKKQLSLLEKELEEDSRRLSQLQHQQHEFVHMRTNAMQTREGTTKEVEHILESCARAEADAKIREEEVQLAGVALGVPEEGFPKTLTEVEMDVRALREHNLNVLGSLAAALEAHPRALETLRHVCDAKQLPVEPRGTLGMATA